jgi:hypothetical protein
MRVPESQHFGRLVVVAFSIIRFGLKAEFKSNGVSVAQSRPWDPK